jgi:isocitrate dehydrogenase
MRVFRHRLKNPERGRYDDLFRENTEDIYAGIEFAEGSPESAKSIRLSGIRSSKGLLQGRSGLTQKNNQNHFGNWWAQRIRRMK